MATPGLSQSLKHIPKCLTFAQHPYPKENKKHTLNTACYCGLHSTALHFTTADTTKHYKNPLEKKNESSWNVFIYDTVLHDRQHNCNKGPALSKRQK